MKKITVIILAIFLIAIVYFYFAIYPKFDIVSGFSSKSIASHHFLAGRSVQKTMETDNNVPSMNLATNKVDTENKMVSSSVFRLKKRTAIYTKGLGAMLVPVGKENRTSKRVAPNRSYPINKEAYPYGNFPQKDTLFTSINYKNLKKAVADAFNKPTKNSKKTRSVLVIYKNQIIAEKYTEGFDKKSLILGWSMAKSITSTIIGVLEKQGKVNLNQINLFKEWQHDARKNIKLRNLLNMNSGLEWEENYNEISDVTQMLFLDVDMTQKQKNKQFVGKPNETWNYSSGTTNLLSGFIRNQFSSQQNYVDFWYTELIDKIGMNSMLIETDYTGNFVGSSYAWATTRDWGKFGLLYLHNGNWNGEQIINTSWVDFTKKPTNTSKDEYGGHFWLNAGGIYPDVPRDLYSANGYQGQYVFIIPSKNVVIVRTGLAEHPEFDINQFLKSILESIE